MKRRETGSLIILGLFVLVWLIYQTPLLRGARAATWDVIVTRVANLWHVGQITVKPDVLAQLQALRAENTRLQYELADYKRLRIALNAPAYDSYKEIESAVLARPLDTWQTEYMLSKGSAEGVTVGAPVVVDNGILIGFISAAAPHSSTVRLLLHPQTSLTAQVMTDDDASIPARGLLIGQNYTSLLLTIVPRDVHIKTGQPIVTVATPTLPAGLTIGAVGKVTNKENEPYQQAEVTLPYDVDGLEAVTILEQP
jgi:rod shape-determining protein MreC